MERILTQLSLLADQINGRGSNRADRILRVSIQHMLYPITEEVLHQVFSPHGLVEKIVLLSDLPGFQALVHYQLRQSAVAARASLQGRNIYDGCCQLDIQFSDLDEPQLDDKLADCNRQIEKISVPMETKTQVDEEEKLRTEEINNESKGVDKATIQPREVGRVKIVEAVETKQNMQRAGTVITRQLLDKKPEKKKEKKDVVGSRERLAVLEKNVQAAIGFLMTKKVYINFKRRRIKRRKKKKVLEVIVEKGMHHGQKIKIPGEADEAPDTTTEDIVSVLQQKDHPKAKRKRNDLVVEHNPSLTESLDGSHFVLTHWDGRQLLIKSNAGEEQEAGVAEDNTEPGLTLSVLKEDSRYDLMWNNDLMGMYGNYGRNYSAYEVFDRMPERNVVDDPTLNPSVSQDQLFHIIGFSPKWAYANSNMEVHVTGTISKSQQDVLKYNLSCLLGEMEVPANVLADGILCCYASSHSAGRVPFYVNGSNRVACSEFDYQEGYAEVIAGYPATKLGQSDKGRLIGALDQTVDIVIEAKAPAEQLFFYEDQMERIDMTEYIVQPSVARLTGASSKVPGRSSMRCYSIPEFIHSWGQECTEGGGIVTYGRQGIG